MSIEAIRARLARMEHGSSRTEFTADEMREVLLEVEQLKALLPVFARFDSFAALMDRFYEVRNHLRDEIKAQPLHATGLQYAVDRLDEVLG